MAKRKADKVANVRFLIDFRQATLVRDIGGKNGDEFSLEGRCFQLGFLLPHG